MAPRTGTKIIRDASNLNRRRCRLKRARPYGSKSTVDYQARIKIR